MTERKHSLSRHAHKHRKVTQGVQEKQNKSKNRHPLNFTCKNSADTPSGGCHLPAVSLHSRSYTPQIQGWAPGPDHPSSPAGQSSAFAPPPSPGRRSGVVGGGKWGLKASSVNCALPAFSYNVHFKLENAQNPHLHKHRQAHRVKTFYFYPFRVYTVSQCKINDSYIQLGGNYCS